MPQRQAPRRITDARMGTLLFCLCWAAYFLTYFGRLNFNAVMTQVIAEGVLTKPQAGMLGTAFFFTYALGQLFSGWLGDRVSPRWFICTGLAVSGVCNLVMGAVSLYPAMLGIWCVNGFVQSFLWPPLLRIFCGRYEDRVRLRACVNINTTVPVGTLVTYGFAAWMVARGAWRGTFTTAGIVLCVFAAVWAAAMGKVERWAEVHGEEAPPLQKRAQGAAGGLGRLFLGAGLALLCAALAVQGMLKDSVTSWAPVYLSEGYGMAAAAAILTTTVIPVLNIFGMFLASAMMKKKQSEHGHAALLYLFCAAALAVLLAASGKSAVLAIALLALSTTAMIAVNTLLISVFPGHFSATGQVATISGILNFSVYVGSALSNYGIGAIAEGLGWTPVIGLWAAAALAGAGLCLLAGRRWARWQTRKER